MTRRTDLALRALRTLESGPGHLRARELALDVGTSAEFLTQVMQPLTQIGWVTSLSGPTGGYSLAVSLQDKSMLELIELMEGETNTGRCVLRSGECTARQTCALHEPWTAARKALTASLDRIPISDSHTGDTNE